MFNLINHFAGNKRQVDGFNCPAPCIDYSGKGLHDSIVSPRDVHGINASIRRQWRSCMFPVGRGRHERRPSLVIMARHSTRQSGKSYAAISASLADLSGGGLQSEQDLTNKELCRFAPLLNEKGRPFLSDFGIHLDGAGIDKNKEKKLAESWNSMEQNFYKSSHNFDVDPITFDDDSAMINKTQGYPYLENNCYFSHKTWLAPYKQVQTVCLLDYMNESLKEYNKYLCNQLATEKTQHDNTINELCTKYNGISWKDYQDDGDNDNENSTNLNNSERSELQDKIKQNSKTKLDRIFKNKQIEQDYVIIYNNNLFEITLIISGILTILHFIKPTKFKSIIRSLIFSILTLSLYYIYKNIKIDIEHNVNHDMIYKLNDDIFNDLNNLK